MSKRDSFIFYRSFFESLKQLEDAQKGRIYDAIFDFALNEKPTELSGVEKAIFTLIKPQLEANNRKYENGLKGAEYGKLGGRPKGKKTPKKPLKNPKKTPNDNDNVNDNDKKEIDKSISKKEREDLFEKFWNKYGQIGNKQQAKENYLDAMDEGIDHEQIMKGVQAYQRHCAAMGTEKQYIKHASTWLAKRCWEDLYSTNDQGRPTKVYNETESMALRLSFTKMFVGKRTGDEKDLKILQAFEKKHGPVNWKDLDDYKKIRENPVAKFLQNAG